MVSQYGKNTEKLPAAMGGFFLGNGLGLIATACGEVVLQKRFEGAKLAHLRFSASNSNRGKNCVLGRDMATEEGHVSITMMHLAKGMEFKVVALMACDDEVIPSQERIGFAADDVELTEIYETERHLLYVASTRARDALHLSAVEPASEFLEDLTG